MSNQIITTLIDGGNIIGKVSGLTYARVQTGIEALGARLDASDAQLADTAQRIDNLVTTPVPTGEIIAEEIIDARDGEVSLGAKIRSNETILSIKSGDLKYGEIELPSDFPRTLPFNLYRGIDGRIVHDVNFDDFEIGAGNVYIDAYSGFEEREGLTPERAVKSIARALEIADTLPESTVIININNPVCDDTRFFGGYTMAINKNIIIKSTSTTGKTVFHTGQRSDNITWIADENIHYYPRTLCFAVIDLTKKGQFGTPLEYTKMLTLAECKAKRGSWYTDDVNVWVNRLDGTIPDSNIIMMLPKNYELRFDIADGKKLFLRNIDFLFANRGTKDTLRVSAGTNINNGTEFWAENCNFAYSDSFNGLGMVAIDSSYLFNCNAYRNSVDGFNYHMRTISPLTNELVFEYNCGSFANGRSQKNTSSNGTTAHDGMNVVRVGSVALDCYGSVLADVNGCYSVMIDCKVGESTLPDDHTNKASYSFNNASAVKQGKAVLINCEGGTSKTPALKAEVGFPVLVKRFNATNLTDSAINEIVVMTE